MESNLQKLKIKKSGFLIANYFFILKVTKSILLFLLFACCSNNFVFAQITHTIFGEFEVCGNSTQNYFVTDSSDVQTYIWEITKGTLPDTCINSDPIIVVIWEQNHTGADDTGHIKVTLTFNNEPSQILEQDVIIKPNTKIENAPISLIKFVETDGFFELQATGINLEYQWYEKSPSGNFNAITDSGDPVVYMEGTWLRSKLELSNIDLNYNNYEYYCELKDSCNTATLNSDTIKLYVFTNSSDAQVCENTTAEFSITGGEENVGITYQWQMKNENGGYDDLGNDSTYSNVTTQNLIINSNSYLDDKFFRCAVTYNGSNIYSSDAQLIITDKPVIGTSITGNPNPCPGEQTYSVAPIANATYSWTSPENWKISGENYNGDRIKLNITGIDRDTISVYASLTCGNNGTLSSDTLFLEINPKISTSITTQPLISPADINGNALITGLVADGSGELKYKWQVKKNNTQNWDSITTPGTAPKYDGYDSAVLKISNVYPEYNGYQYRCIVTGDCGSDTTDIVTLTQNNTFSVIATATPSTVCKGETISFKANIETELSFSYVWKIGAINIGNVSEISYIPNFSGDKNITVTASHGTDTFSDEILITVNSIPPAELILPEACQNEKGVLITLIDSNNISNYNYTWSAENVSAFLSDSTKSYFIINTNDLNPIISVEVKNKETSCKSINNKIIDLTESTTPNSLPETIEWKEKGEYMLIFNNNSIPGKVMWGTTSLNDFIDRKILESTSNNYWDFWPNEISSDALYWIQVAGYSYCASRYYYGQEMTVNQSGSASAFSTLHIYPNPSIEYCYISPSPGLTYPCTVSYYNMTGELVRKIKISDKLALPYSDHLIGFKPGIYVIRLTDSAGISESARIIISNYH